jgi:hypothetical protein
VFAGRSLSSSLNESLSELAACRRVLSQLPREEIELFVKRPPIDPSSRQDAVILSLLGVVCSVLNEPRDWDSAMKLLCSDDCIDRLCKVEPHTLPENVVHLAVDVLDNPDTIRLLQGAGDAGQLAGALSAWLLAIAKAIGALATA